MSYLLTVFVLFCLEKLVYDSLHTKLSVKVGPNGTGIYTCEVCNEVGCRRKNISVEVWGNALSGSYIQLI